MTYLSFVKPSLTTLIEITKTSSQTASTNSIVLFDNIRATSTGHGVSINSSTGEISLAANREYQVIASLDVDRSSTTTSYQFAWIDSNGAVISVDDGGYDANFVYSSSESSTMTAVYQPSPLTSAVTIRLKALSLSASSTINTNTSVLILEVKP
jgi:hypothetical protein